MPLLRSFLRDRLRFYKDAAPTALEFAPVVASASVIMHTDYSALEILDYALPVISNWRRKLV
jgi:hypothetical protein